MMFLKACRNEFRILWILSICASLVVIISSFYLTPKDIDSGAISFLSIPHEHCPLCGMSHSLTLMSRGLFQAAFDLNPGGPFLYASLAINSIAGLLVSFRRTVLNNIWRT
jgi:hypothetical protein